MELVYCASCGKDSGTLISVNATSVFWVCDDNANCFEKYKSSLRYIAVPQEVYFETLKQEQLEQHGRVLTNEELHAVAEANTSPLATLINEGRPKE